MGSIESADRVHHHRLASLAIESVAVTETGVTRFHRMGDKKIAMRIHLIFSPQEMIRRKNYNITKLDLHSAVEAPRPRSFNTVLAV